MSQDLRLPPSRDTGDPIFQDDVFSGTRPFQYHPLKNSEPKICLFNLRGRDHSRGDIGYQLNCELIHLRISELPSYRALSYTWGETLDPIHSVLINGQDIKIRENLWQALVHLQSKDGGCLFWIDAICTYVDRHQRNYHRNLRF
jgi:hypothetical protein